MTKQLVLIVFLFISLLSVRADEATYVVGVLVKFRKVNIKLVESCFSTKLSLNDLGNTSGTEHK